MIPRSTRQNVPWILTVALAVGGCSAPVADAPSRSAAETARLHFIIPGAPGGGWDGTARGVGEALAKSRLVSSVSFENLSGGGGGRAMAHLIATAQRQQGTLMVSSTPIVLSSLRGRMAQSWRDLTPIAAVIGDYITFVVRRDSEWRSWGQVVTALSEDPRSLKFAGGSVLGGTDHLVTALAWQASGLDPKGLAYVPYDAGGKAMAALLSGETPLLTTGLGEAIEAWRAGLVHILAITAAERSPEAPEVPTLGELGADLQFVNWRGFFAAPGLEAQQIAARVDLLERMLSTPEWEEVRRRNGWVEIFRSGHEFTAYLEAQEKELEALLDTLEPERRNGTS